MIKDVDVIEFMSDDDYDFQEEIMVYISVNWNVEEDEFDEYVWDKVIVQFWLDIWVLVLNDCGDW